MIPILLPLGAHLDDTLLAAAAELAGLNLDDMQFGEEDEETAEITEKDLQDDS